MTNFSFLPFWETLQRITSFSLFIQSQNGSNKQGEGTVCLSRESSSAIIFNEQGIWQDSSLTAFRNIYRWTLDHETKTLSLEHLRQGKETPVFLFHFIAKDTQTLTSLTPHVCNLDTYSAQITWDPNTIRLKIEVFGPKKKETIESLYKTS